MPTAAIASTRRLTSTDVDPGEGDRDRRREAECQERAAPDAPQLRGDVGQRKRDADERRLGCVAGTATYSMSRSTVVLNRSTMPIRAFARAGTSGPLADDSRARAARSPSSVESPSTRPSACDERDAAFDRTAPSRSASSSMPAVDARSAVRERSSAMSSA